MSIWTIFLKINVASKWVKPHLQNLLCFLSSFMANFSENLVTIASIFPLSILHGPSWFRVLEFIHPWCQKNILFWLLKVFARLSNWNWTQWPLNSLSKSFSYIWDTLYVQKNELKTARISLICSTLRTSKSFATPKKKKFAHHQGPKVDEKCSCASS